jgi:hypothetical protein
VSHQVGRQGRFKMNRRHTRHIVDYLMRIRNDNGFRLRMFVGNENEIGAKLGSNSASPAYAFIGRWITPFTS